MLNSGFKQFLVELLVAFTAALFVQQGMPSRAPAFATVGRPRRGRRS
jgi:hypothetical protein